MKFGILALDYDGTIATDGLLDPDVKAAIAEARASGVVVVVVTGRTLADLRNLLGDLRLFDSVVAENGAMINFPDTGNCARHGAAPPHRFLEALERRQIKFTRGECVVEADAQAARPILEVIRELELPLVLLFNRGRMMILPQAISKATGLRHALRALRLSEHNAIAIGDAENDHQLLQSCEIGLAVDWGSESLKASADGVIPGQGPSAIAGYIRKVVSDPSHTPRPTGRRRLVLGIDNHQNPVSIGVRGRNLLVAGDPQTGKSWVAGLLAEQLILQHYSVCLIDAEGDYRTLEALPGVIVLGGDDPAPRAREIIRALRYPDVSLVIDLSRMRLKDKKDYVTSLLSLLFELRCNAGIPHRVVVDEAHYFLGEPGATTMLDLQSGGYTLVTYQVSSIHPAILAETEAIILTRDSDPTEALRLRALEGCSVSEGGWEATLRDMALGEALLLAKAENGWGSPRKFSVAPRLTAHVRHQHKYLDVPVADGQAFVFCQNGQSTGIRARTLREFISTLVGASRLMLDGHLRKGDFSRWIDDVFRDPVLAREIRTLESEYRIGQLPDVNDALIRLIKDRYDFGQTAGPAASEYEASSRSRHA